mgnify:CR=1 FL=1
MFIICLCTNIDASRFNVERENNLRFGRVQEQAEKISQAYESGKEFVVFDTEFTNRYVGKKPDGKSKFTKMCWEIGAVKISRNDDGTWEYGDTFHSMYNPLSKLGYWDFEKDLPADQLNKMLKNRCNGRSLQ